MSDFVNRFEPEKLLELSKCYSEDISRTVWNDDERLVLRWDIPNGSDKECIEWVYANRGTLSDFDTPFRHFEGIYRVTLVDCKPRLTRSGEIEGTTLLMTIAKGLSTTLDWDTARVEGIRELPGNSESVSGIGNTTSDDDEKYLRVKFPYCSPIYVRAIVASIADTYSNVTIRGEDHGTFHRIAAQIDFEDDGTATIHLFLARPQFTLNAYQDVDTAAERDVHYLWGVPKPLAQGIIDAWGTTLGHSATASYSTDQGTCDLVLSSKTEEQHNLDTSALNVACDTTETYHFAWGYDESSLGDFLSNHGSSLDAGVNREIRVSSRGGDGLFDAVVMERTVTYAESKHKVSLTLFSGDKTDNYMEWGWNVPKTTLASVQSRFDTSIRAVNKRTSFDVTRHDNCTFDYRGSIVTETVRTTGEVSTSGTGINVTVSEGVNDPSTPNFASTTEPRKRVQIDASKNDLNSFNWKIQTVEVLESVDDATTGTSGVIETIYVGRNVDVGDLQDILTGDAASDIRRRVVLDMDPNDDNTFNYRVKVVEVQEVKASFTSASVAGLGVDVMSISGKNTTYADLATNLASLATGGARKRIEVNLSPNDDGTVDYQGRMITVQKVLYTGGDAILSGALYRVVTESIGHNADPSDYTSPDLENQDEGVTTQTRVDPNDDGTIGFRTLSIHALPKYAKAVAVSARGAWTVTVTVERYENQLSSTYAAIETANTFAAATQIEYQGVEQNDDGTYNWTKITTVLTPPTGGTANVASASFIEQRRDTAKSRYTSADYFFWAVYYRTVSWTTVRTFSTTHPNGSGSTSKGTDGANTGQKKEVSEVLGGLAYVLDTTTYSYGAWSEPSFDRVILPE